MGRSVKNPKSHSGITDSLTIPSGTTAKRPLDASLGAARFNTSFNKLELWNGTSWRLLASEGTTAITTDTFTGDGSTTVFGAMSFAKTNGTEKTVQVFVGNVHQNPGVAYTFDGGTDITFTSPPPAAHTIIVLHGFNSTVAE